MTRSQIETETIRRAAISQGSELRAVETRHAAATPVELSIVVPVHNEATGLDDFFTRLLAVLVRVGLSHEIICIDDGSTDESLARLLELRARVPAIKVLSLSRNFGKDVALSAGLDHAAGAAVIPIYSDLQDPP